MVSILSAFALHFIVGSVAHTFIAGAASGLAGGAAAFVGGDILDWMMGLSWIQALIGKSLNTAKIPGIALAKMLQTGSLKNIAKLVVIPVVYIGFWFLTALDSFMDALPQELISFLNPFLSALAKVGSKDRFTYVTAKMQPPAPSPPAQELATAIASPTAILPPGPITDQLNAEAAASIDAQLKTP